MTVALVPNSSYRLLGDCTLGRCDFHAGEVVTYIGGGYSRYDDCYLYEFSGRENGQRICASPTEWTDVERENFELVKVR